MTLLRRLVFVFLLASAAHVAACDDDLYPTDDMAAAGEDLGEADLVETD